ncbi:PadR family transcriptional regulator [Leifsonia sp. YAF41]|uniref:PadR family transcriptional regulator n=1 Tax=Leifsonia sp. YAF41 TaxID=3233086 RepID=UPI003F94B5BF
MSKRVISNPLALAVLSCLWERPMYPYEMTTNLRERGKEDSIKLNFGSLYAVIKSLEKHQLIEASHTEREGNRPERIVYAITDAGRVESREWLSELLAQPVKEYPAFETGLSLMPMLPPADAIGLLQERLDRLGVELAARADQRATALMQSLPELFLIEFDYRVAIMTAERDFVASSVERFANGSFGGMQIWTRLHELLGEGRTAADIQAEFGAEIFGDPEFGSPGLRTHKEDADPAP